MDGSAAQNGAGEKPELGRGRSAGKECMIFRPDSRSTGRSDSASQEAVFAARKRMRIAHKAALQVLGIAPKH